MMLLWVVFSALSCSSSQVTSLASIESVSPDVLEHGDVLEIFGEGFVEGPTQVTFDGAFDPHGLVESTNRQVILQGTAVSPNLIRLPVTGTVMKDLARETLDFSGAITVEFPSALVAGEAKIFARAADISMEIRPGGGGVKVFAQRSRQAERTLELLGLELFSGSEGDELVVQVVHPGGPADLKGVDPSDRLLAVNGLTLESPSDLAGLDPRAQNRFEFLNDSGEVREFQAILVTSDPLETDEFVAVILTSIMLGFFLAFTAGRRARQQTYDSPTLNPLASVMGTALVCLPLLVFPALCLLSRAEAAATILLICSAAVGLTASTLYGEGRIGIRLLSFVPRLLAIPAIIVLAGTFGGNLGTWSLVQNQGENLWGWTAWSSPFTLIAAISAMSLSWPEQTPKEKVRPGARMASWLFALSNGLVIVVFCFGGWLPPGPSSELMSTPGTWVIIGGAATFALKSWIVILASRAIAEAGYRDRRSSNRAGVRLAVKASVLIASTVLALVWHHVELPNGLEAAGTVLAAGISVVLAAAFVASRVHGALFSRRLTHRRNQERPMSAPSSGPYPV